MRLTLRARFALYRLIDEQKNCSLDESEIWAEIKGKIAIPDDALTPFIKDLGNGQSMVDQKGMNDALDGEGEDYQFEKIERRKMLDALKPWKGFHVDDSKWNRSLIKQLEESLTIPIK